MDDCDHITDDLISWPQSQAPAFCQEDVSATQNTPADMLISISEQAKTKESHNPFLIQTPQIDFTSICGSEGTEPSTSLKTNFTEAACSNYPVSLVQELRPKLTEWTEDQDFSFVTKDPNPVKVDTLCLTVEDPYFEPESTPTTASPTVMKTTPAIWIENACFPTSSSELHLQALEVPLEDGYSDKGMTTQLNFRFLCHCFLRNY